MFVNYFLLKFPKFQEIMNVWHFDPRRTFCSSGPKTFMKKLASDVFFLILARPCPKSEYFLSRQDILKIYLRYIPNPSHWQALVIS